MICGAANRVCRNARRARRPSPPARGAAGRVASALAQGFSAGEAAITVQQPAAPAPVIAGTWDFKWPLDSRIRVAFQRLPAGSGVSDSDFNAAKQTVKAYAGEWEQALRGCRLGFVFLDDDLDPPLGEGHSLTDQHRSPFCPEEPLARPYDVLISLQNLPVVRVDPFQGYGARNERTQFPVSELGTYALRLDYGAPSMYLGCFAGWRRISRGKTWLEYFKSDLAAYIIVHEFGHMLGLPHMHQHPDLMDEAVRPMHYDEISAIQAKYEILLGEAPDRELIEQNVIAAWPADRDFSDWLAISKTERDIYESHYTLNSVMMHPHYGNLIRSAAPGAAPIGNPKPGARDESMLAHMYRPSRPPVQAEVPSGRSSTFKAGQPDGPVRAPD
jgi:hypothetical protein